MPDVKAVEHLSDYLLLLTFDNGESREVDIARLASFEGVFAPLKDPAYFWRVEVNSDIGTIVWPNGADICPDVLYEQGKPVTPKRP